MASESHTILGNGEIREKIALRAYEIYQDRGGQHGRDLDDWLQAESEVLAEVEEKKALYGRKRPARTDSPESSRPTRPEKKPRSASG